MKIELLIFGITGFMIINTYYDGKYLAIMRTWKKYYQIAMYAFLGLSVYLFIKKNPQNNHSLIKHFNGLIKYMPIDKNASEFFSPFIDMTSQSLSYVPPQQKRMMTSGGSTSKRSVSETKKKYVAANQNWKCHNCQQQLSAWFEVDHRQRLCDGGSNEVGNLVALCRNCHGEKTAMENLK